MTVERESSVSSPTTTTLATGNSGRPFDFNDSLAQRYIQLNNIASSTNNQPGEGDAHPNREQAVVPPKRPKSASSSLKKSLPKAEIPTIRYADFGGLESIIEEIKDVVERPFRYRSLYKHLGVEPPRGVLLHGVPGCGKSSLVMAMAGELGIPLIKVAAPELVAGMSGESEGRIRDLFEGARSAAPCLLFIDEIDAIATKRDTAQREMERRIVAQMLACMDELAVGDAQVMVIGATNRPDALDPALRRAGRFDREIQLTIPNEQARVRILTVLSQKLRLSGQLDLAAIARNTPGFVGADLKAITQEAAAVAIKRIISQSEGQGEKGSDLTLLTADVAVDGGTPTTDLSSAALGAIEPEDFEAALKKIQPSAKREGFAIVPNIRWEDIGALGYVRAELRMAVVEPLRHPEKFASVGLTAPAGVLLWGPPGCGKTLLAKAVANESHSNFISVKGPELLSKYVGESEKAVRQVFERARHSAPCIVFFDELDALCPRRSDESDAASRVVNQLLTEMDGLEDRRQVFVLAATNRPDMIDPAMRRPGRLDKLLYVNLPDAGERAEILRAVSRNTPWSSDVNLVTVAQDPRCEAFSGADLAALIREASMAAVRESIEAESNTMMDSTGASTSATTPIIVTPTHVESAFSRVAPSVSSAELLSYETFRKEKFK